MSDDSNYRKSAEIIKTVSGFEAFDVGVILGSGLGVMFDRSDTKTVIPYRDIPGFTQTGVDGHAGNVITTTVGNTRVIALQGRAHLYEGHPPQSVLHPIRTMKTLGVTTLVQTNSAGGIHPDYSPGSLVMIRDHINFFSKNPLIGPNDSQFGPRFFDMSDAYAKELREKLKQTARNQSVPIAEGVYAYFPGPNFETPAEINAMKVLGADLVGMSTVPETLAAVHAGIKVIAVSCVTNQAAGISPNPLSHEETLRESQKASQTMCRLLLTFIAELS